MTLKRLIWARWAKYVRKSQLIVLDFGRVGGSARPASRDYVGGYERLAGLAGAAEG